jgi:hypothetical protein
MFAVLQKETRKKQAFQHSASTGVSSITVLRRTHYSLYSQIANLELTCSHIEQNWTESRLNYDHNRGHNGVVEASPSHRELRFAYIVCFEYYRFRSQPTVQILGGATPFLYLRVSRYFCDLLYGIIAPTSAARVSVLSTAV